MQPSPTAIALAEPVDLADLVAPDRDDLRLAIAFKGANPLLAHPRRNLLHRRSATDKPSSSAM
ncbi:MAG: hypothetical protein R3C44_17010 [Chloroflexota bacterium]